MIRKLACIAAFVLMGLSNAHAATLNTLHTFCCQEGTSPWGGALLDPSSGALYGTLFDGGKKREGSIYAMVPSGTGTQRELTVTQIYEFCANRKCRTGANPRSHLIMDTAGNLYGMASFGGSDTSKGTVFELMPNADKTQWKIKVLHVFCRDFGAKCTDGSDPANTLTYAGQASGLPYDGSSPLYGTTLVGGVNDNGGTVFKLVPTQHGEWSESIVYSFCPTFTCTDGSHPDGDLTVDGNGNLFGTTYDGGANNMGTVYEVTGVSRGIPSMTVLYSFCFQGCQDGLNPLGGVTFDGKGNLFGTTVNGGGRNNGTIYELSRSGDTWREQVIYSFCSADKCPDGSEPAGNLTLDASGNFYGTTSRGGGAKSPLGGTVYKLSPGPSGGYTLSTLHAFCLDRKCSDGTSPASGVVMDSSGNFFSTTAGYYTGKKIHGTVFELTP